MKFRSTILSRYFIHYYLIYSLIILALLPIFIMLAGILVALVVGIVYELILFYLLWGQTIEIPSTDVYIKRPFRKGWTIPLDLVVDLGYFINSQKGGFIPLNPSITLFYHTSINSTNDKADSFTLEGWSEEDIKRVFNFISSNIQMKIHITSYDRKFALIQT